MNIAAYTHLILGFSFITVGLLFALYFLILPFRKLFGAMTEAENRNYPDHVLAFQKGKESSMIIVDNVTYSLPEWRKEFTQRSETIVNLIHNKDLENAQSSLNALRATVDSLPFYGGKNTEYRLLDDLQTFINAANG